MEIHRSGQIWGNSKKHSIVITEKDLILGILWEGDLEIHTNMILMKKSRFRERIIHGDTVAAKVVGAIMASDTFSNKVYSIQSIQYKMNNPVYIDDTLTIVFNASIDSSVSSEGIFDLVFDVLNESDNKVLSGNFCLQVE